MSTGLVLGSSSPGGSETELTSPTVGIFTAHVAHGEVVTAGQHVGTIEVLGVKHPVRVPDGVAGRVTQSAGGGRARVPVEFGASLLTVAASVDLGISDTMQDGPAVGVAALTFTAPMSGRFYQRPSPNEPPFIKAGDTVRRGQTIGLLEVMKTFNRLVYQGDDLPSVAVVEAIVPAEGDDVVRGDVILTLQAADEG